LIREIRRMVGDRLANYMRLIENLINPVNVSMFVFSMVRAISPEEKNKLSEIYKELTKNELAFIERDLNFSEEKEALFIKESYELWKRFKIEFASILEKVEKGLDNKKEEGNRNYFG